MKLFIRVKRGDAYLSESSNSWSCGAEPYHYASNANACSVPIFNYGILDLGFCCENGRGEDSPWSHFHMFSQLFLSIFVPYLSAPLSLFHFSFFTLDNYFSHFPSILYLLFNNPIWIGHPLTFQIDSLSVNCTDIHWMFEFF